MEPRLAGALCQSDTNFASVKALFRRAENELKSRLVDFPKLAAMLVNFNRLRFSFNALYLKYSLTTGASRIKLESPGQQEEGAQEARLALSSHDFAGELKDILLKMKGAVRTLFPGEVDVKRGGKLRVLSSLCESIDTQIQRVAGVSSINEAQAAREAVEAAAQAVDHVDSEKCMDCNLVLKLSGGTSDAICPGCGRVYNLYGLVDEEVQPYSQDGQRMKSGQFSPSSHYAIWINSILALESKSEIGRPSDPDDQSGEKLIEELKLIAKRTNKYLALLDVEKVRKLLQLAGRSGLYRNAPLILKELTGISPPRISEEKRLRGETMFSQAVQTRKTLEGVSANRNYYPYYIYKIYDIILDKSDPDRFMLWFIYFQSQETLTSNDREWKLICAELGWPWRSTDPAEKESYRKRFGP